MTYPTKYTRYGQYWLDLALYMDDPATPKPLVVKFGTHKEAVGHRLEFYAFRNAVRRDGSTHPDPKLANAFGTLEGVEARIRDSEVSFGLKDASATAEAFAKAFEKAGYDPMDKL